MPEVVLTSEFCYGHRLLGYNGKCARLHGHNAKLEVTLGRSTLTDQGFVIDFSEAKAVIRDCTDQLDHYCILQDTDHICSSLDALGEPYKVFQVPPTAENIATYLLHDIQSEFETFRDLVVVQVKLWETVNNYVIVE